MVWGELPKATGTIIEVADFGALPDDAVDDSAAIQRAIDAANAVAGPVIVRFAAGTYRVTSVLKITRSDFVLQGQGGGRSRNPTCTSLAHSSTSISRLLSMSSGRI